MRYLFYLALAATLTAGTCNRNVVILITEDCSDKYFCTVDIGTYVNDSLTNCFHQDTCDYTNPCTGVFCDDNNACTIDSCDDGHCVYRPVLNITLCDDGNPCTNDLPYWDCPDSAWCMHTNVCIINFCDTADCDDNNACTWDTCYSSCYSQRNWVICSDNNPCTADFCTPSFSTQIGYVCNNYQLCDDGEPCTIDQCDTTTFQSCHYTDTCHTCSFDTIEWQGWCKVTVCVDGDIFNTLRDCSDNDACTNDACFEITHCIHTPIICDDGSGNPYCCIEGVCIVPCFEKLFDMSGREMKGYLPPGMYLKHEIENGILKIRKIIKYE